VLVIDEAQNLAPPVLEQIRLLSNLETEKDKLLQIILIGQPELAEVLALRELRQLNQRITARYHLKPLTETETLQYIAYRLHVAGGRRKVQFDRKAVRAIYRFSGGVPRVINAVCDRALLVGYTKEVRTITAPIVRLAAREIRGERVRARRTPFRQAIGRLLPSPALLVTACVIVLLAFYGLVRPLENLLEEMATQSARPVPAASPVPRPIALDPADAATVSEPNPAASKLPEPERSDFITALLAIEPGPAIEAASAALLDAWNVEPVAARPEDDTIPAFAAFAVRNGLAFEVLRPALDQLLVVNLPTFVKMRMGTKDCWLALTGVEEDRLRLTAAGEETVTATREEFQAYYAGEAVVLWRDPTPGARVLLPNSSGETVARLKEALRRTGRLRAENMSNVYDAETAMAVSRLQAESGLLIDGLAGKQVRMALTSWLPETPTPALRALDVPAPEPNVRQPETPPTPAEDAATADPAPSAETPDLSDRSDQSDQSELPGAHAPTQEGPPAVVMEVLSEPAEPPTLPLEDIEKPATQPVPANAPLTPHEGAAE